jgi:hypothetical protein
LGEEEDEDREREEQVSMNRLSLFFLGCVRCWWMVALFVCPKVGFWGFFYCVLGAVLITLFAVGKYLVN